MLFLGKFYIFFYHYNFLFTITIFFYDYVFFYFFIFKIMFFFEYIFIFKFFLICVFIFVFFVMLFLIFQVMNSEKIAIYACGFNPFFASRIRFEVRFFFYLYFIIVLEYNFYIFINLFFLFFFYFFILFFLLFMFSSFLNFYSRWFLTNHEDIGSLYLILTCAGVWGFSVLICIEFIYSGGHVLVGNFHVYSVVVSAHALIMLFLLVMPELIEGIGNYLVSLFLGSSSRAFSRFNDLSFWLLPSSLFLLLVFSFIDSFIGGGWTVYPPVSASQYYLLAKNFALNSLHFVSIAFLLCSFLMLYFFKIILVFILDYYAI